MPNTPEVPIAQPVGPSGGRPPSTVVYVQPYRRSLFGVLLDFFLVFALVGSVLLNFLLLVLLMPDLLDEDYSTLTERYHSGTSSAGSKIAMVQIDGPIIEGLSGYFHDQLRAAARDEDVKAVVVAINSPGGSVTASDQLHKQISDLRDGKWPMPSGKTSSPKPVVVAMQAVAASGGYYIAVPGQKIFAEPTTITGSIGVYAPILDLHELAERHGVKMHIIKKGELKASGSMFKELTPEERAEFDEQIEAAYQRFMQIVQDGRKDKLKVGLRDEIQVPSLVRKGETVLRRLADGGVYTAQQAKEYGLIDDIGYVEDAVAEAKKLAKLQEARVVVYEAPLSLLDSMLGIRKETPAGRVDLSMLPGMSARAWYLTPGYELSGLKMPIRDLFPLR
ncbi:MAG: signal peptide peptidase SppA [Gemmatales bacterium]|nr:signal peptide peptidase SppA [Gemmatales bacterium]MDW8386940.1 signal peptide peptidase SppA [Gemmatales bacterium]